MKLEHGLCINNKATGYHISKVKSSKSYAFKWILAPPVPLSEPGKLTRQMTTD